MTWLNWDTMKVLKWDTFERPEINQCKFMMQIHSPWLKKILKQDTLKHPDQSTPLINIREYDFLFRTFFGPNFLRPFLTDKVTGWKSESKVTAIS